MQKEKNKWSMCKLESWSKKRSGKGGRYGFALSLFTRWGFTPVSFPPNSLHKRAGNLTRLHLAEK